jgi:hypothetical protein
MPKRIFDKAEVSIDFPDKYYHGSFSRSSQYDVSVDEAGIHITLDRRKGAKRHIAFHLQYHLFSDILFAIAENLDNAKLDQLQRKWLTEATESLLKAANKKS